VATSLAAMGQNSIDGGYVLSLRGDGFGSASTDVLGVTVGTVEAISVSWNSSTLVQVVVPPGIGTDLPVVLRRRDGLRSVPIRFSYATPVVARVVPPFLLPGIGNTLVTLLGNNLATRRSDILRLAVGNYECSQITVFNSSAVSCALLAVDLWTTSVISLTDSVGARQSFNGIFIGLPEPRVVRSRPAVAAAGDTV